MLHRPDATKGVNNVKTGLLSIVQSHCVLGEMLHLIIHDFEQEPKGLGKLKYPFDHTNSSL